jgi:sulfatase maturation enzyme AslB (radical SAM superfamily)
VATDTRIAAEAGSRTDGVLRQIGKAFTRKRRGLKLAARRAFGQTYIPDLRTISLEVSGLCNLACRFCGYPKKVEGLTVMANDAFARYLDQAVAIGYRRVSLTPLTGDVFMDKRFLDKVALLEAHPGIEAYEFFTNLILADQASLDALSRSRKLRYLHVSLYGHDGESFTAITQRPQRQYERLLENLDLLAARLDAFHCEIEVGVRTRGDFAWSPDAADPARDNALLQRVARLCRHDRVAWTGNIVDYDNWGGLITGADVAGLGMHVAGGPDTDKNGACHMIFSSPTVLADGKVNACACRGVDRSLVIGDANTTPLAQILSPVNPAWRALIDRQQRNDFPPACKSCKFYASIYRKRRGETAISLDAFMARMQDR